MEIQLIKTENLAKNVLTEKNLLGLIECRIEKVSGRAIEGMYAKDLLIDKCKILS